MVYLGSLDSSRDLQANYAISFLFHQDLILHACAATFDVIVLGCKVFVTKQGLGFPSSCEIVITKLSRPNKNSKTNSQQEIHTTQMDT